MINKGTNLNVIDNSGAKTARCIRILSGFKKPYATLGNVILVVIKEMKRASRGQTGLKVSKGMICKALVLRVKKYYTNYFGDKYKFDENSIILLNKNNKFTGTKIFGPVSFFLDKQNF